MLKIVIHIQDIYPRYEFKNFRFKVTITSSRSQWVNQSLTWLPLKSATLNTFHEISTIININPCKKHLNENLVHSCTLSDETRTTRTPAFWGYPPPPHDYPHFWDICQRSSHATHLLMLVIICTKYGKNPSRTVDATERTRFSRSRQNDLEDIGQGQRSLYATHPLMVVIICAKYGKNPSRIVDFFFQGQGQKVSKICQNLQFSDSEKT